MITERIDAVTAIPDTHRKPFLPAPKSVKIELTGRCNYRCGFCALRMREKQPRGDMDFDLFKTITREMREAGVEEIGCFFLGESMMAPDLLVDSIRWCKAELDFPYVFLTTNGSMASPEVVEDCMKAGLDSLKFSVNNYDEDQFKQIVQVKPKLFHDALKNIKRAREVRDGGYETRLYASSIRYDGDQQVRMENLLEEWVLPYVDEHYWLPLYSMGAFATQREEELGYRPIAGNQGRLGALREPLPCWSLFTEGHVTHTGKLSACCFDANEMWTMADLTKASFMEAWNSKDFQELRKAHLKKNVEGTICENCIAYS